MGYNYCVFGAGRQGVAAVYDLVKFCEAECVVVLEPCDDAAHKAAKRLNSLLGLGRQVYFVKQLEDADLANIDVMISCAPWSANLDLARKAVDCGIPFCDLGGNPATVIEQEGLEARSAVVPDCGLSPGISNILAVHLAKEGCDEIRVRCGGISVPFLCNRLKYRCTFDPMGLISEYSGDVPMIENGNIRFIPALSKIQPYRDVYECAPTSNNSLQAVESLLDLGVLNYDYMTIRPSGHWDMINGWKAAGFLQGDKDADHCLSKVLSNNPDLKYDPEVHTDRVVLSVVGKHGEKQLRETQGFEFEVRADIVTRLSAMELMTSWGITIVAHWMAVNPSDTPKGFATPEKFMPGQWILNELEKRLVG